MIIEVGGNQYDVDILSGFTPVIYRAVKFKKLINGKTYSYDKSISYDKIRTKITLIGDISYLKTIAGDIKDNKSYLIFPDTGDSTPIFGNAINESVTAVENATISHDIKDKETALLKLDLVTTFFGLTTQQSTFPNLRFPYPVNRNIGRNYKIISPDRNSVSVVRNSLVDNSNVIQQYESVSFKVDLCDSELEQLQSFYLYNRGTPFLLTTNSILELFFNSTATNVIFTDLAIKHKRYNQWEATVSLSNSVI